MIQTYSDGTINRGVELNAYPLIDYSLVLLYCEKGNKITKKEFCCAFAPNYDDKGNIESWGQGHYFNELEHAIAYIKRKENEYWENL